MKTFADYNIDVPNRGGAERYTTCPECSPRRKNKRAKCLSVNVDKGVWICHHCGWKGNLKQGGQRHQGELHWQAPEYRTPSWTDERKEHHELDHPSNKAALDYLFSRGLTLETIQSFELKWATQYFPQTGDFRKCFQFPYWDQDGKAINVKYRDLDKNFRFDVGCRQVLYGLELANEDELIFVEGEFDRMILFQVGFTSCVSVPNGAPPPDSNTYGSKFSYLEHAEALLKETRCFVLAVDNDEAGKKLEEELIHRLGKERCKLVTWPEDCKDANDVYLKHGEEALKTCIRNARPYPIEGTVYVSGLMEQLIHLREHGIKPGLSTGWENLDPYYRVSPGEYTTVTGIPNHGKSTWLNNLLTNMAKTHHWRTAIFSPENTNLEWLIAKLISTASGKSFNPTSPNRISPKELKEWSRWLNYYFIFIKRLPDKEADIDWLCQMTESLVLRHGIRGCVYDPWNEIEHDRQGLVETDYVSLALGKIGRFVKQTNIHCWLVAHPTKINYQMHKGKDRHGKEISYNRYAVPTAYDISGSANFRNKADNCITIYREPTRDLTEVYVQKVRNQEKNGKPGKATLIFNPHISQFNDYVGDSINKGA